MAGTQDARGGNGRALARLFRTVALAGLLAAAPALSFAQDFAFSTVRVEGTQRIEPGTVASLAAIERGQSLSAGEVNAALQRVQNSGFFESVEFVPQGGTLVIRVVEYPTINRINIEGNRRLDDDRLLPVLQSQSRLVYSPATAEADARRLAEVYAAGGRLAATVTPRIIRQPDNRVDLVFEVTEGRVVENERIAFVGNQAFSDRRLRGVIDTKQAGFLRQLIQRDTFVPERLALDRQLLTDFYRSRGYVDFEVVDITTEFTRERDASIVTVQVREGQQYRFGTVGAASEVPGLDAAAFDRQVRARPGRVYTPEALDETIARMEAEASRQGFDFVRVDPRISRNAADGTIDVTFTLVRGPRVFVERIDIAGNRTTLDRVVRRQFDSVEGDPFNPREIRESASRIRALGFFSRAEVQSRPGSSPDQVVVDVDLEEQPTGALSFGVSVARQSGAAFAVSFSERNFLGRGQTLRLDVATGVDNAEGSVTFIEPSLLGRDLEFRFDGSYRETVDSEFVPYDTTRVNIQPSLGFPVGENSRLSLSVFARSDTVKDVETDASAIIAADDGDVLTFGVGYTYTFDTRRSGFDPNSGVLVRFGQEFGAGDSSYVRTTALASAETRVLGDDVTLRATVEGGAMNMLDGDSRITDRFFPSSNTLRGFDRRGVGPRDLATGDALGGNYFAVARFEADFPLGIPEEYGISGGVFYDIGSVWGLDNTDGGVSGGSAVDDSLLTRQVVGVSLFWTTPIGPLRFNFSRALELEDYDKEQTFDFTISTRF
ncbi:MAG: outer membrane protein assembly factor BamA [Rhodobacteraceae bacterium]|jgi:outer membrane protein insertion porin family|nr:outer membrane protein assembly factor BamA [Paracoccaceae bacterium]